MNSTKTKFESSTGLLVNIKNVTDPAYLFTNPYWYLQCYIQNSTGETQLHLCMIHLPRYKNVAHQLINITWPLSLLDIRNNDGMTALHLGAMGNDSEIVRQLLVAGASPMSRDNHGCIPLHYACREANIDVITALTKAFDFNEIAKMQSINLPIFNLFNGVNVRDNEGTMPIHLATENGRLDIVELLLSLGAKIDSKRYSDGRRPLHIALLNDHKEIAEFILEYYRENPDNTMMDYYCCPDLIKPLRKMSLEEEFINVFQIPIYKIYTVDLSDSEVSSY